MQAQSRHVAAQMQAAAREHATRIVVEAAVSNGRNPVEDLLAMAQNTNKTAQEAVERSMAYMNLYGPPSLDRRSQTN